MRPPPLPVIRTTPTRGRPHPTYAGSDGPPPDGPVLGWAGTRRFGTARPEP